MTDSRPIVLLSDGLSGGAARAATNLFRGLVAAGAQVELWHFSEKTLGGQGSVLSLDPRRKRPVWERLVRSVSPRAAGHLRKHRHTRRLLEMVARRRPAVIHCHNLHGCGLDHAGLLAMPREIPVVWTLHDCWAFQPDPFEWFDPSLGRTDRVAGSEPDVDAAKERRRKFFAARPDVALVAPSRWLCGEARRSLGEGRVVRHIPYGLPPESLSPLEKSAARAGLKLDVDRFWIGLAAFNAHRRKGADLLAMALKHMRQDGLGLLTWGRRSEAPWPPGLKVADFGMVNDPAQINRLYSACDVFVCPSRADNFPLSVLESMACGTAVVGSDRGGTAEAIRAGRNGSVFTNLDSLRLAETLEGLRAEGRTTELGRNARQTIESQYTSGREVDAYLELYSVLRAAR